MKTRNFEDEYLSDVKNLQEPLIPGRLAPLDLALWNVSGAVWGLN